ncbi:MAG: isoprenyl transferase [Deltaproteobacteria bacterium]|nr:isoprenyl transferase [Deltaproteobacteria bacterium]
MLSLDPDKIPHHIAIIMDGNGRWAMQKKLPRLEGHRKGTEIVEEIVIYAKKMGVKVLTLYAFSSENWQRPPEEVKGLMDLLKNFLSSKREKLIQNKIRLHTIGETALLPPEVLEELQRSMKQTEHFDDLHLVLALSYGSRYEILKSVQQIVKKRLKTQDDSAVSEEELKAGLQTSAFPDPDLLIRTSGEFRISNFLLWQIAYSELYFTEKLWPDFVPKDFLQAVLAYQKRERRFGMTSDQLRDFD